MKTVLVTGSSGQSGREIAKLLEKNYNVIGLDIVEGEKTNLIGNITNWNFVKEITLGVDFIIHTASIHAPHVDKFTREHFIDTNVKGTLYLLEAAKLNGVQKMVYTSTTSIYGEAMDVKEKAVWITENIRPIPRDIYDITKLTAENICKDFYRSYGLPVICLRVSRFWNEPVENKLFYRMYRGLDVRDVAKSHLLAIENNNIGFEIFNISANPIFTEADLVEIKKDATKIIQERVPELFEFYNENNWEMAKRVDRVYVIEKARKFLGYSPKFNVKEMINELKKNKVQKNKRH